MSVCCRMASAMIPPAPLRPRDFRLGRLATWAGLGAWIDQFLVGGIDRFRLHFRVLRLGFRLVLRALGRSAGRIRKATEMTTAWETFDAAAADFKTLDSAHVESFKALLLALAAEERSAA